VKDVTYKDYMLSDPYLIRWLRARNLDLNRANAMLRKNLKWRKENGIDDILNENILELPGQPPFYRDGVDFEGSIVVILLPARVDMRKYLLNGKRDKVVRMFDQLMEMGEIQILGSLGIIGNTTAADRPRADVTTVINDMHGYTLRQHACLQCLGVYIEWFTHMESYYPGYTKHIIVVNAPRIAASLIELLKPVVSPETRNILQIYGSNKNEWIPVLRKLVPQDQVRANLGGTKPDN